MSDINADHDTPDDAADAVPPQPSGETLGSRGDDADNPASKDPADWVTGDEPMTAAQKSYLGTLAREAGEEEPGDLTKAQASVEIDRLQEQTGRGKVALRVDESRAAVNAAKDDATVLEIDGHDVRISHPDKIVFSEPGLTKLDLVTYYLAVADGALRGAADRPMVLKRFVKGIDQEAFFQKRAPAPRPDWIQTAVLNYARGTSAEEVVVTDAAALAWVVNLGCIDLNPHPVRAWDLEHPDELRIDLDPMPGVGWSQIVDVAMVAREVLAETGLIGWPKTSGSRGIHIYARIEPRWTFPEVRLAAETLAREVENRAPGLASAHWWKEERGESVFVDFNQNAKDRTVASAYSIRALPDARVSTPLDWDELRERHPEEFTLKTVLRRFAERGDPSAGIDGAAGTLDGLLALAERLGPAEKAPASAAGPAGSGRRTSSMPLIEIARAKTKGEAIEGMERWSARHPNVVALLEPSDTMVDGMRGSSSLWYRIRVNLQHVPEAMRPEQAELEIDYDPWAGRG